MTNPKADPLREALTEIESWKNDTLGVRPKDAQQYDCAHEIAEAFDRGARMAFYRCAERAKCALASQPAAAPVGGREEIAAFLLARDGADTNVPVPHGLILWAHNLLTNGKDAAHSGDCTNECHSCVRCTADRALRDADAILAAAGRAALQKDAGK